MATVFHTTFSKAFSSVKKYCILITIVLKCLLKDAIDNIAALVQIMAWRRTGDKPLSEPMMTEFGDAYMRLAASMTHAAIVACDACMRH